MGVIKLRRKLKWFVLYMKSMFNSDRRENRIKPSKNLTDAQRTAVTITAKTMLSPDSKLYYNMQSHECYIYRKDSDDSSLYIFIESGNIKIINTVFGYDINIDQNTEQYLTNIFTREMAKRRSNFKKEALAKIEFSLHKVLDKIDK